MQPEAFAIRKKHIRNEEPQISILSAEQPMLNGSKMFGESGQGAIGKQVSDGSDKIRDEFDSFTIESKLGAGQSDVSRTVPKLKLSNLGLADKN